MLNVWIITLNAFYADIQQQPEALRECVTFYRETGAAVLLDRLRKPERVLLTGMGASYHAALWASYVLQAHGIWAIALQTSELISYSRSLLDGIDLVVFISQSGASGEVLPFVEQLPHSVELIAITNDPQSPLANRARTVLPLLAGREASVATRTYLNSLACLWLLAQVWHHGYDEQNCWELLRLADRVEQLISHADDAATAWLEALSGARRLCFLGHGPHTATAQQAVMMLGEWAKHASIGTSIGAFRHGLIEIVDAETGVVVFGAGGVTHTSTQALVGEMRSYGARVISISEGKIIAGDHDSPVVREFDEMLGVFLDVIPGQLFAEAMARHLGVAPGFRHISKVVRRL
jgi:glucosamine--fructose-6-phosphate aminotransferase (isomerizing)